jgi:predicted metal-dependent peptidase
MRPDNASHAKLIKARVQLLFTHPFFASLCLRLSFIAAPVQTMSTDGKAIYYSEKYVDSLTPAELQGVLAHEALHCALGHHCRRGKRTPDRWNDACDYAINPIILQNELTLPANALIKKEFDSLSAEEIYARLPPEAGSEGGSQAPQAQAANGGSSPNPEPQKPQTKPKDGRSKKPPAKPQISPGHGASQPSNPAQPGTGPRPGAVGDVTDATGENRDPASEAEKTEQEQDWAVAAEQAARIAKTCGHVPLGVDRLLQEARESKKDWRSILRDFVAATIPTDYRFCPPNRRYVHAGLYLPSVHKEGAGKIVIGVDTSGSIGDEELKQFAGEISAISDQAQPEAIHVVYCDARVHSTQEFGPSNPITLQPAGGGGTDFRPVFEWVDANDVRPVCLIYLTDLACNGYPASPPDYPVLWVTDSRKVAPFGETLQIVAD